MMKLRLASPAILIDINNIPGLAYIKEDGGFLKIGALTREVMLEESDIIRKRYPIFTDASKLIADPQVRNMGTIGGNIAHGDAANDHPAVLLALRPRGLGRGPGDGGTPDVNHGASSRWDAYRPTRTTARRLR